MGFNYFTYQYPQMKPFLLVKTQFLLKMFHLKYNSITNL
jgi:hypothetical protein